MIKNAMVVIGTTARDFFRGWRAAAVFNLLYAALLVALYLFVLTKESSVWQLVLTALLATAAPILFFLIQAAGAIRYTRDEARPLALLAGSLKTFWKLILISIPVILLAVLAVYLLNKLQAHFPLPAPPEPPHPALVPLHGPAQKPPIPFSWTTVLLSSLRVLILGVVLPLAAIHLWIAIARDGLLSTLKKGLRVLGRAFSAQSVLIYAIGLVVFGLMPYFLIFTRTPLKNNWAELALFGLRLALAFIFTLSGWIITLGALAKATGPAPAAQEVKA